MSLRGPTKPDAVALMLAMAREPGTFSGEAGGDAMHPRRLACLIERWYDHGWVEVHVSVRTAQLTELGLQVAAEVRERLLAAGGGA